MDNIFSLAVFLGPMCHLLKFRKHGSKDAKYNDIYIHGDGLKVRDRDKRKEGDKCKEECRDKRKNKYRDIDIESN